MKKIFMMCLIFITAILLLGCNNAKINVKLKYKNDTYNVNIIKGSKLNVNELNFINNKEDAILYYGDKFQTKYNNECLESDITMMVCDYNGSENLGKLYSLQDAYQEKYLTENDIRDIYNNYKDSSKKLVLSKEIELKILNDRLAIFKNTYKDAKLEDISIYGYYGNFNNSYVIRLNDSFNDYSQNIKELKINDVVFEYSGPTFLVWVSE